ncbi:hypothetical protein QEM15_003716 [Pseudomonas putida]|nr:hypothetical protein [Pseudomonas putida]
MSILFKGDNKALIVSINALLALDAKGALTPHGIGEMARDLLETCAARLPVEHHQGEPVAPKSCDEANQANGPTFMGEPNPHHSIEWYREGISKHWKTICDQRLTIERLTASLKFYADRDHYSTDDGSNWDSCSGEPSNILWHESEPWFIEDGSIARAALESKASDDIPDFTPGNGNKAERRATALLAQLQADLTARDEQIDALSMDAGRYRWLRSRDLEAISQGGVFAGLTPDNLVLNEETLDQAIDAAMAKPKCRHCGDTGQIMVGRSGQAEDGNAPIMELCEDCDRGMPDLASRPEERGTPETEPCSGCGTPGWTGACNKCVPY